MNKIEGYQCEFCKKIHSTEQGALICEKDHVPVKDLIIIGGGDYQAPAYGIISHIPRTLTIRFTERSGDFGIYLFNHYSFRGV